MPAVSKAEFSRVLGVSKARVTQYVAHGLPTLPSGKVDLDVGTRWVAENFGHDDRQKGKGSDRAKAIVKSNGRAHVKPDLVTAPALNADAGRLADALKAIVVASGPLASQVAVKAGAPMQVAYAIEQLVSTGLADVADKLLPDAATRRLHPDWPFDDAANYESEDRRWAVLAAEAGELVDEDGWERHLAEVQAEARG